MNTFFGTKPNSALSTPGRHDRNQRQIVELDLQLRLNELLPAGTHSHFSANIPRGFELTVDELKCCTKFARQRMIDFKAGRYCASEALRKMGVSRSSILVGDFREPIWPTSIVGSISHTKGLAGAIVSTDAAQPGLGLDLEQLQALEDTAAQFCTAEERSQQEQYCGMDDYLTVVFSAKEAVYKCVWPIVRQFISFHDVQISVDANTMRFAVSWHNDVHPVLSRVSGFWVRSADLIATVAVLSRD